MWKRLLDSRFEILDDIYGKGKEWEFMPQQENPDAKRLAIREAGKGTLKQGTLRLSVPMTLRK
jgi:hypothetical protein